MDKRAKRRDSRHPPRRIETRSNLFGDMVLPILVGVAIAAWFGRNLDFAERDTVTWLALGLLLGLEGLLVGYVFLWLRSRRERTDIEFRDREVWLPPGGMRVRGRTVRYADLEFVEISGPGTGRRVKVAWSDGSLTYGWSFIGGSMQAFAKELEARSGRKLLR